MKILSDSTKGIIAGTLVGAGIIAFIQLFGRVMLALWGG